MVKRKFYLYRMLQNQSHGNAEITEEGVIWSEDRSLLGLDRMLWRGDRIQSVEQILRLKPFEVEQRSYERLITLADKLKIAILSVKFTSDLDYDDFDELKGLLRANDAQKLIRFIENQRFDQLNEIEEITFATRLANNKAKYISFSRDAVLTLDDDGVDLNEFLSAPPIGILSGNYMPYADLIN